MSGQLSQQDYETVPVGRIQPHPDNARRGNLPLIRESIRTNGFYGACVVQRSTGRILVGNHRYLAAVEEGLVEVPVVWVDKSDDEARRLLLVDNRTTDLAVYDDQALVELLSNYADDNGGLVGTGWDDAELAALLAAIEPPQVVVEVDVPPLPTEAVTKVGDLILLGEHRLMCGDATDPACYETVLDAPADMVWSDPPYGVSYVGKTKDALTIENDDLDEAQLAALLGAAFDAALASTTPGGAWFIAAPAGPLSVGFSVALHERGIFRQLLIWVKDSLVMGHSDYHYRHELVYYGWAPGGPHTAPPDRKQDTIWEIPRPKASKEHPTMKPIELVTRAITNHTKRGAVVLDMFGGSGTTLLAAEQTDRTAALIELDPAYCDVIVERWEKLTGQSAQRP